MSYDLNHIETLVRILNDPFDEHRYPPYEIAGTGYVVIVKFAGQIIFHSEEHDDEIPLTVEYFSKEAEEVIAYLTDPESVKEEIRFR